MIEARAFLMAREKGKVFFWGDEKRAIQLDAPYHTLQGGTQGFYASHHTMLMSGQFGCKIDPSVVPYVKMGTFIHESLHFLFNQTVRNHASPVKMGSVEERLLDEALAKDRAVRQELKKSIGRFTSEESSVLDTFYELEDCTEHNSYFPHGFSPDEPRDLETMRSESIVRIMEQVASGVPLQVIRKLAPHLSNFYFTYSKPMLERYARGEPV